MLRHTITSGLLLAAFLSGAFAQEPKLETTLEKASYIIGRNIGETILRDDLGLDSEILVAALKEAFAGTESRIPEAEANEVMEAFQKTIEERMAAKEAERAKEMTERGEKNKVEGPKFLAENRKREGVKVTESGLQYEVLEAGSGAKPKAEDMVSVHYHGTLLDGTVFDSSVERKVPAEFPVEGVIAGWTEALQMMPVGAKWKLYVPAELAYGEDSPGGEIAPNSTLIFEVQLLEILKDEVPVEE